MPCTGMPMPMPMPQQYPRARVDFHAIDSFAAIPEELLADRDVWAFVDIDNTLLTTRSGLGTQQCMDDQGLIDLENYQEPVGRRWGFGGGGGLDRALQRILETEPVQPCDPAAPDVLRRVCPERIVFVTERPDTLRIDAATRRQLDAVLGARGMYADVVYSPVSRKGHAVLSWIRAKVPGGRAKHLVIIDDTFGHLESVMRRIPYGIADRVTCLLYTGQMRRVLQFHADYPAERQRMHELFCALT